MKRFKTFDELRQFVKNGGDVYWQTNNYAVVYMFDDLRITAGNGGSIGCDLNSLKYFLPS